LEQTHYRNERNVKIRKPLKFHVLLTTPEMAIADEEFLSKISWEVLICDEAQRLKNRQSRLFTTLENFSFQHTVLLSGTPLQNNIGELFALLSFIDRNHFCDFDAFMKQYGNMSDAKQVEQLQEEIRPYMLRRLKGDVEKSLPGKEETLVEVELTMLQKKFVVVFFLFFQIDFFIDCLVLTDTTKLCSKRIRFNCKIWLDPRPCLV
jgi:SNF2 family DNA or RNA helicase